MYYEGTFENITKRKKAEESLLHTMGNLRKSMGSIIQVLASVVETKDPSPFGPPSPSDVFTLSGRLQPTLI
jgi:hypothetical protein